MTRTICSIFFQPLKAVRPFKPRTRELGYLETFKLPAAPRDGYVTLAIEDMDELFRFSSDMDPRPTPVFADKIATDLVREWAGGVAGESFGGPGVFICAGDAPTVEELASARRKQTAWCNWLVNDAQGNWINGNRHLIRDQHRDAAAWMGLNDLDWVKPPEQRNTKKCPLCRSEIDATAIICPNCRQVIDFNAFQNFEQRQKMTTSRLAGNTLIPADLKERIETLNDKMREDAIAANPEIAALYEAEKAANPQ